RLSLFTGDRQHRNLIQPPPTGCQGIVGLGMQRIGFIPGVELGQGVRLQLGAFFAHHPAGGVFIYSAPGRIWLRVHAAELKTWCATSKMRIMCFSIVLSDTDNFWAICA